METLSFETQIHASAEKIWQVLWDEDSYREWTAFFSEGSQMQSDWKVNGKTFFLDNSGQHGMVSTIELLNPPYEVVFKHLGYLQDGKEVLGTKEVMEWSGSQEKYLLTELEGYTKLHAEAQTSLEHKAHMEEAFTKGLAKVKELAEN